MPTSLYESLLEKMGEHQYSHYFSAYCPFDEHKTPALLVYDDGKAWCLSCTKQWTHEQIQHKIGSHYSPKKYDTVSAVLPQWKNWEKNYGDLGEIAEAAHRNLVRNKNYQTYLRRRKIHEFIKDGHLGYLDGWITFPVLDSRLSIIDIVVRSVQRNTDVRYVIHPGGSDRALYVPCWRQVLESETIYVVYGMIDAISLHLAGLPSVTGMTGKSLSYELLSPLRKRFIIIPDDDEDQEARKLANKLGWRAQVKKIDYDKFGEDIKDPDGIRRSFGNQILLQALS
jgi:hypothetical protein